MSDVERVEQLLRSALVPVEPPERLSDRLERGLSELTEAAADELADWELSAMRDPRNWVPTVTAIVVGSAAAGGGSCSCAPASSTRSARRRGSRPSSAACAAWPRTSRSACAARRDARRLDRRGREAGAEARDRDQQVQQVVLGVDGDEPEEDAAVACDEAGHRYDQVEPPPPSANRRAPS